MQVNHVKRDGNGLACTVAQYAKNIFDYVTWIEENPCMIESSLARDVLSLSPS